MGGGFPRGDEHHVKTETEEEEEEAEETSQRSHPLHTIFSSLFFLDREIF